MGNKSLSQIGEIEALCRLRRILPADRSVLVGAGDDCAVVSLESFLGRGGRRGRSEASKGFDLLLTSDPVIESVHFRRCDPAGAVGHKALGRVLSDIAAMGGRPLWAVVDVVAPRTLDLRRLMGIYRGMVSLAHRFGVSVVGGDLSEGNVLQIHVFCVGIIRRGGAILRSGARVGDKLFVTGSLGGSGSGRHLRFEPRVKEGQWLAANGWASSMIDLSDGLASDLRRINELSSTGAKLILDAIPLSRTLKKMGEGKNALRHALCDGEDFELLFTVAARKAAIFSAAWRKTFNLPCSCIGCMTGRRGIIECVDAGNGKTLLNKSGFIHFKRRLETMRN